MRKAFQARVPKLEGAGSNEVLMFWELFGREDDDNSFEANRWLSEAG